MYPLCMLAQVSGATVSLHRGMQRTEFDTMNVAGQPQAAKAF